MLEMMIGTASRRRFSVIDPWVSGARGRVILTASVWAATDFPGRNGKSESKPGPSHFLNHVSERDKSRGGQVLVSPATRPARWIHDRRRAWSRDWQSRRAPCYCSCGFPEAARLEIRDGSLRRITFNMSSGKLSKSAEIRARLGHPV